MNIRGHHLLCIFGFRGLGYSHLFVENFSKVIEDLRENPSQKFRLVDHADVICAFCPHLVDGRCAKEGFKGDFAVEQHDRRVFKALGLKLGDKLSFKSLTATIFKSNPKLEKICPGCKWLDLGYCQEGLGAIGRQQGTVDSRQ